MFFLYVIEQHSKFLLHTLQVLYMCTFCDSTNINTIIEFVPHVSGDGFNGGSDSYLQLRDTHSSCLLKLCIPPSNGVVRWWLFPEFGAELLLDNCTPTIILNNPVFGCNFQHLFMLYIWQCYVSASAYNFLFDWIIPEDDSLSPKGVGEYKIIQYNIYIYIYIFVLTYTMNAVECKTTITETCFQSYMYC